MYKSSNKRIAKNTLLLYFRMLAVMLVGIFTSRVTLDALGVRDFGLYNVVGAIVGMLTFVNSNLSQAASRFLTCSLGNDDLMLRRKTFSTMINLQLALIAFSLVILLGVGLWVINYHANIPPERLEAVRCAFYCVVGTTAASLFATPFNSAIIAYERMGAFAWMSIFDVGSKLAIAYALYGATVDRLKLYAALMLAVQVIYSFLYVIYCKTQFGDLCYCLTFDRKLIKEIFSFAGWSFITSILIVLTTQGFTLLNQKYFGPELVAAFTVASMVQCHVMSFISNFRVAANPQIVKSYAAGRLEESKNLLIDSTLLSVFILLVLGVPTFVYADQLLALWLVEVPQWSVTFVRIILVGTFFSLFDISLYMALYAKGRLRENVIVNVVNGLVMFSVAFVLIRVFHWEYATAFATALMNFVLALFLKPFIVHKVVGYEWKDFIRLYIPTFRVAVLSAAIGWLAYVSSPSGALWMFAGGAVCAFLVAITSWFAGVPADYKVKIMGMIRERLARG